jgi:hypothetical protein
MPLADDLRTTLDNYAKALAADSINPQPSYTMDGKSVQRNEWRRLMLEAMRELAGLISGLSPYWVETRFKT